MKQSIAGMSINFNSVIILPVLPGGVSDGDCVGSAVVIVTTPVSATVSVSELTTVI